MTRALSSLLVLAAAVALGTVVGAPGAPACLRPADHRWSSQLTAPPLARAHGDGARRRIDAEQRRFTTALHASIPDASVHWRYRLVANGVSVVLPSSEVPRLGRLPGVRHVYGAVTYRTLAGPDAAAIRARDIPGSTLANAGAGIKIGIIDDGVDQAHPFFDPTGYAAPDGFPKGQLSFTTAKVIVARAFPPPGATWRYAREAVRSGAVRPRHARRRDRGREREHARGRVAHQRHRPARVHRQLQGADRARPSRASGSTATPRRSSRRSRRPSPTAWT